MIFSSSQTIFAFGPLKVAREVWVGNLPRVAGEPELLALEARVRSAVVAAVQVLRASADEEVFRLADSYLKGLTH